MSYPDTPSERLKWIRLRQGKYETATAAARAYGWKVPTYLGHENGDRTPSRNTAKRYARAYHIRWEWLLEGEGNPTGTTRVARVVGTVGIHSEVAFLPENQIREVEAPPDALPITVALEVRGGSMRGIADDGWLFFFDDLKQPPTKELVGKVCIMEIDGGKVLVRTLQPGRKRGRFDLESATEPTIRDARVIWAAKITWIKPA